MPDSTASLTIVPWEPQYADGVLALIVPIQREEFGIAITADDQPDLRQVQSFYQRDDGNFWVAISGDAVVGTIALLDIDNRQGALRKMFVQRDYRGATFSTAARLLRTLLDWSASRAMREIYLGTTSAFVAAHRFYEKHGFVEISKRALPPAFPVMAVDSKFYRKTLPESRA